MMGSSHNKSSDNSNSNHSRSNVSKSRPLQRLPSGSSAVVAGKSVVVLAKARKSILFVLVFLGALFQFRLALITAPSLNNNKNHNSEWNPHQPLSVQQQKKQQQQQQPKVTAAQEQAFLKQAVKRFEFKNRFALATTATTTKAAAAAQQEQKTVSQKELSLQRKDPGFDFSNRFAKKNTGKTETTAAHTPVITTNATASSNTATTTTTTTAKALSSLTSSEQRRQVLRQRKDLGLYQNRFATLKEKEKSTLTTTKQYSSSGSSAAAAAKSTTTTKASQMVTAASGTFASQLPRKSRTLLGIFTSLTNANEFVYRQQYRKLFATFRLETAMTNETTTAETICSLRHYIKLRTTSSSNSSSENNNLQQRPFCDLIYTFVVGANPNGRTRNLGYVPAGSEYPPQNKQRNPQSSFLIDLHSNDASLTTNFAADWNKTDMTALDIRENIDEGKSETWFAYAASFMKELEIDYIAKANSDAMIFLDGFFQFSNQRLLPSPYNRHEIVGVFVNKYAWMAANMKNGILLTDRDFHLQENVFKEKYGKLVHIYAIGQCYLYSLDLAQTVVQEAEKLEAGIQLPYLSHHEDHDISAMAFQAQKPIQLIMLAQSERFWTLVKINPHKPRRKELERVKKEWTTERYRLKNALKEQKQQ